MLAKTNSSKRHAEADASSFDLFSTLLSYNLDLTSLVLSFLPESVLFCGVNLANKRLHRASQLSLRFRKKLLVLSFEKTKMSPSELKFAGVPRFFRTISLRLHHLFFFVRLFCELSSEEASRFQFLLSNLCRAVLFSQFIWHELWCPCEFFVWCCFTCFSVYRRPFSFQDSLFSQLALYLCSLTHLQSFSLNVRFVKENGETRNGFRAMMESVSSLPCLQELCFEFTISPQLFEILSAALPRISSSLRILHLTPFHSLVDSPLEFRSLSPFFSSLSFCQQLTSLSLSHIISFEHVDDHQVLCALASLLSSLPHLSHLALASIDFSWARTALPPFHPLDTDQLIWSVQIFASCFPRLRSLRKLELLNWVFPEQHPQFLEIIVSAIQSLPSLEELNCSAWSHKSLSSLLRSMATRHPLSSLKSLNICAALWSREELDVQALIACLATLPRLESFVCLDNSLFLFPILDALASFCPHFRSLQLRRSLQLQPDLDLDQYPVLFAKLRQFHELTNLNCYNSIIPRLLPDFSAAVPALASLSLDYTMMPDSDLDNFPLVLSSFHQLQSLSLSVHSFDAPDRKEKDDTQEWNKQRAREAALHASIFDAIKSVSPQFSRLDFLYVCSSTDELADLYRTALSDNELVAMMGWNTSESDLILTRWIRHVCATNGVSNSEEMVDCAFGWIVCFLVHLAQAQEKDRCCSLADDDCCFLFSPSSPDSALLFFAISLWWFSRAYERQGAEAGAAWTSMAMFVMMIMMLLISLVWSDDDDDDDDIAAVVANLLVTRGPGPEACLPAPLSSHFLFPLHLFVLRLRLLTPASDWGLWLPADPSPLLCSLLVSDPRVNWCKGWLTDDFVTAMASHGKGHRECSYSSLWPSSFSSL